MPSPARRSPPHNLSPTETKALSKRGGPGSRHRSGERQRKTRCSVSPEPPAPLRQSKRPLKLAAPVKWGPRGTTPLEGPEGIGTVNMSAKRSSELTPWCLFGFFLGIQKETRRRLRPQARFGAQPPAGRHLARRWRRNLPTNSKRKAGRPGAACWKWVRLWSRSGCPRRRRR